MIEHEETTYKQVMKEKLSNINAYLKRVHETLSATHREPELEKLLRDLDEIAINVGMIENGEQVIFARKKCGVTNQDLVARQMKTARKEIEKVERLEEEREFKNAIDKLSIVKMTHKLKGIMEKWETANANEKILLSQEMIKMKDTLSEREKRMHSEIQ